MDINVETQNYPNISNIGRIHLLTKKSEFGNPTFSTSLFATGNELVSKQNKAVLSKNALKSTKTPGAVFMKGLSQVLGLTFVQKYSQLKPETWLRPFVNTAPDKNCKYIQI